MTGLYIVDALAVLLFCISYYRNCYRKGYRIDVWHLQLFMSVVLVNQLMLPFALSDSNAIVTGEDTGAVIAAVPHVFLVSLFGYAMILAGGALWRVKLGIGLRRSICSMLDIVPRCSQMMMSSKGLLVFHTALCLLLQLCILVFYFGKNGFGFNLRAFTFAEPSLRPIALVISTYTITTASHCFARYLERKEKVLMLCTLALTVGITFFGARANILAIYFDVTLCYFILRRSQISLVKLAVIASSTALAALYMGSVRAGEYSLGPFAAGMVALILFGSTFSDLREFAWIYARWDGTWWAGKTYLAALFAFVPRWLSSYRDTWGIGVVTATTAGFDPHLHPGLRPGMFGESYFNFGYLGVMLMGLLIGVVTMAVDIGTKRALALPSPSMTRAFSYTMLLGVLSSVAVTAGASGIYVLGLIYVFSWVCLRVGHLFAKPTVAV